MNNPISILTLVAALGSGLVAGIFFAFSGFIMHQVPMLVACGQIISRSGRLGITSEQERPWPQQLCLSLDFIALFHRSTLLDPKRRR